MAADLSIVIPARNEKYLKHTIEDIFAHSEADTEVIVILDAAWPTDPLPQHPKLKVVFAPEVIGQRAATNLGVRLSRAKFVMKVDAHCAFAQGFDRILINSAAELGPNVTQVPAQKNLKVYDQVCEQCGYTTDQAPDLKACTACGCERLRHDLVWQPRQRPTTTNWVIDSDLHFQYASDKGQRGDYPEVMSILGACLFVSREHYWELGGFDESIGSWGNYGQEWSCREWLSGGRVVCNRRTWFAHFFRVGGIGFPYQIKASEQEQARQRARDYWRGNNCARQIYPLRWLVDKFWPLEGWTDEQREDLGRSVFEHSVVGASAGYVRRDVQDAERSARTPRRATRGVVYYSDCRPSADILDANRRTVEASGMPIVAVTLQPIRWPSARNIVLSLERGYLTMFRQILAGLEALDTDYVFFAEHDLLYHYSHWDFTPPTDSTYYYNCATWKVDYQTGRAITYLTKQTSGLCANRELLIEHYRKRVARVEAEGFSRRMGFEPGSHHRPERVDDVPSDIWRSAFPNIDIRHARNLTASRWSQAEFRDKRHCQHWQEADEVPGWGVTRGRMKELLIDVSIGTNDMAQAV